MRRRESERHPWPPQAWAVAANAKGSPDGRAAAFRAATWRLDEASIRGTPGRG
jgi:hypothetical protein